MGKKARKTRWRTLEITDEHSDSEESHTTSTSRLPNTLQQKSYYNKLPYSSQSTPRRKYQYDSTKSTRSSSTASENKITFNEDEYTRITTPRQDVLFKKGYLNKPKNYQTQTSTGTSTTSTGNSTGNGTPDHQSTDLEYDSQFVFPNGFVDQNGIYYVNSFEPYPLMLYNPPTYYTECSNSKSKRCSTSSLTESTSPNNEEVTSQDLSGGEASNNVSDYSSHHSVYNMVYPGYYVNGGCPPQEVEGAEFPEQTRKSKKRRRRKTSRSQTNNQENSSECSEDEDLEPVDSVAIESIEATSSRVPSHTDDPFSNKTNETNGHEEDKIEMDKKPPEVPILPANACPEEEKGSTDHSKSQKYDLKPDAEEFIPRAYRSPEISVSPVQFIKVPPNFVPIPMVPFNGQINPAFIPTGGIPINFIHPDPKLFPSSFVNFVPGHIKNEEISEKVEEVKEVMVNDQNTKVCDIHSNTAKNGLPVKIEKLPDKSITSDKTFDIATVVYKLKEAAKEQKENDENKTNIPDSEQSPVKKPFRINQKYRNRYKRNFYDSPRNSPQRQNGDPMSSIIAEPIEMKHIVNDNLTEVQIDAKSLTNSPEKFHKNWKNNSNKWQPNGVHKSPMKSPRLHMNIEPNQGIKQFSDTLKNSTVSRKPEPKPVKAASAPSSPKASIAISKLPDQWISVSSRKKRKNKNLEESEISFEDTTTAEEYIKDEFESYDISMLVDVVPPAKTEEESIKIEDQVEFVEDKVEVIEDKVAVVEEKVEDIINVIAQTEPSSIQNNSLMPDIRSVTDIENELIVKEESSKETIITEGLPETKKETDIIENTLVDTKTSKKKSRKGAQRSVTKRVIITDVDLSDKCEDIKPAIKKIVKKVDKPKELPEIKLEEREEPVVKSEAVEEEPEEDKKKNKKKKKKGAKAGSSASSTNTSGLAEDAYDMFLDATLAAEADKTNDEISVELDKMIQKGIYSNLEEKMKSLNLSETDGFFRSVFSQVPVAGRPEPSGFLKSPDFTKIPLFKPDPVSEENKLESKKTNDELPASESPKIFLENQNLVMNQPEESKSLYPITEAVKEWISRTRETTPDVEIFKSPSTIYKELCESDTNSDTEVYDSRNQLDELGASVEEDEITLFTAEDSDKTGAEINEDLLEYWEDLKSENSSEVSSEVKKNEDEEELEVYESKYGTNEDFIKLQKEAREKATNTNYPKHGNLPYRAICCNIM